MNVAVNSNWTVRNLTGPGGRSKCEPKSSIIRLRNREIFGFCKKNQRATSSSKLLFSVLPRRFAFPLTSLVEELTLHEDGHVFLGFSSCDRFLISYTVRIEEARHTGFLSHIYTLHWWLWSPASKAKKVGSVRLFANEEIEYSLFLCYAEWPTLKSQIIVYGWRKGCESCYITIAAVPSLLPCIECSTQSVLTYPDSEEGSDPEHDVKCKVHGFAMHFKQASGTSQSGILNSSGLKIDGLLILNIGHSIAVLSTGDVSKSTDLDNLALSSIKRRDCEDTVTEIENDVFDKDLICDQRPASPQFDRDFIHLTSKILNPNSVSVMSCPKSSYSQEFEDIQNVLQSSVPSVKASVYDDIDNENDHCEHISLNRKSDVSDKENFIKSSPGEQFEFEHSLSVDPYFDPEPKSIVLGGIFKDSESPVQSEKKHFQCMDGESGINCHCLAERSNPKFDIIENGAKLCTCGRNNGNMQSNLPEPSGEKKYLSEFRSVMRNKMPFLSPLLNLSVLNERQNSLEVTRSDLNFVTPSPTASDGSSSVQFSSDSNIVPSSSRQANRNSDGLVSFSENFYGPIRNDSISSQDPLPVGETSLNYCSMMCHGAGGEVLHPLERDDKSIQAFSQHLVLDLEHVIFDVLRTRCYVAYKYGYLVDYEANIMDVCSSTKSVIVHVAALLSVQRDRSKCPPTGKSNKALMQQAEFILRWSLYTGRYEVVVARPLFPYDERKSGEWKGDWIIKLDSAIKQQCSVRCDPYRSVYILDNAAVLRGRSLNVLWNCDRTLALTR